MTYKALDVREHYITGKASYNKIYGSSGTGNMSISQRLQVTVIAEESIGTSRKRVRFEFASARQYEFLGETCYTGYTGDWDKIVIGDYFNIEETNTYKNVVVINTL